MSGNHRGRLMFSHLWSPQYFRNESSHRKPLKLLFEWLRSNVVSIPQMHKAKSIHPLIELLFTEDPPGPGILCPCGTHPWWKHTDPFQGSCSSWSKQTEAVNTTHQQSPQQGEVGKKKWESTADLGAWVSTCCNAGIMGRADNIGKRWLKKITCFILWKCHTCL